MMLSAKELIVTLLVVVGGVSGELQEMDLWDMDLSTDSGFAIESDWKVTNGGNPLCMGDWNNDGMADLLVDFRIIFGSETQTDIELDVSKYSGSELTEESLQDCATGDINGDGIDDLVLGSPFANSDLEGAYVFYGSSNLPATLDPDTLDGTTTGYFVPDDNGMELGYSVAAADINGDGYDDVVLRAPGVTTQNKIVVVFGAATQLDVVKSYDIELTARWNEQILDIVAGGDVQGDGFEDIAFRTTKGSKSFVYVLYGAASLPTTIPLKTVKPEGLGMRYKSTVESVAFVDFNGDDLSDLVLGVPGDDETTPGAVYILKGRSNGVSDTFRKSAFRRKDGTKVVGTADASIASQFGKRITSIGDVNADDVDDILITATATNEYDSYGYVLYGRSGYWKEEIAVDDLGADDGYIFFETEYECGGGDFNGDGISDIATTIWYPSSTPRTTVVYGSR